MSGYGRIEYIRNLDVIIIDENNATIYEGKIENAPKEIKELEYKKIEAGNPTKLYV